MMQALLDDDVETLRDLLDKGASRNQTDEDPFRRSRTPLMVACEAGSEKAAQLLLDVGADPLLVIPRHDHYRPAPGWNALCFARYGRLKSVESRLVSMGVAPAGACLEEADFLRAVEARDVPEVKRLAARARGRFVDAVLEHAISMALVNHDAPLLRAVLAAGVPVQKTSGWEKGVADLVEYSLYEKHVAVVDALLDAGIRPPVAPLAAEGLLPQLRRTLAMGASPNGMPGDIRGPLLRATANGHLEVVRVLLKAGANVNGGRFENERPLLAAVDRLGEDTRAPQLVKVLLDAGASTDVERRGDSLLALAVDKCHAEVVSALLRRMSPKAIAREPGAEVYVRAVRAGAASCPEAEVVRVLEALVAGGLRIQDPTPDSRFVNDLRKQAKGKPALAKVLNHAGLP